MTATIRTPSGFITQISVAWYARDTGRPVYTWRTRYGALPDDRPAYEFATPTEAQAWTDAVWEGETRKERARAGWQIITK